MPRPRIYFTKEQQKLANSIKCKKSYEKHKEIRKEERQRKAQLKQKNKAYKRIKKKGKSEKGVREMVITTSDAGVVQTSLIAMCILSKSWQTFTDFTKKIRALWLFAEDIYHTYLNSSTDRLSLSLIQDKQYYLSECVASLQEDWDTLYQTAGACQELEDIKIMKTEVSLTLSY
ncbi:hypothetical protein E1B28_012702 [Marasmius oreades]|uniref:Uncharacterized protein n=1 Tax=Marasmius oreades TaxID=181124 RepID=A0A9P7RS49_9AGAR|nr:uncharacterized protein E1B28_012702 [Marasmius oreades]KAG7088734.1 hypothetical protein E1B28_012702 [Marasmius oreades]